MTPRESNRGAMQFARRLAILAAVAVVIAAGRYGDERFAPATAAADEGTAAPQLPEIRFQDASGNIRSLADFRGRVVLLNLWATWCVPCRKEMPSLDRLQALLGGPAFEVVALSIDRSPQAVREFYQQYGIRKLALYIDPSAEVTSTLGAVGIPTTVLVDRDGRERWRRVGPAEWDASAEIAEIRKLVEPDAKPRGRGQGLQQ
ncbi:TlpA family protein disulfide reductase [Aromatoleum toluclasticum]|uniref:TlpA family protein disulfide reductase n=1 Tax=Aromatoleum toluclasticum TaxID=92003 RepID=UPI0018DEE800|nr:TlpA disulfide reductase family protein [Aromatoleum toluclasticum]